MKYVKFLVLTLLLAFFVLAFTACDGAGGAIKDTYVDEEMHLIVEYTDGSKKDLGYVGVEVEVIPPKYTVTFFDVFGQPLKTEKVYKGDAATAPTAPEIADKSFDKWDVDFSAVMGDLTVRPVYVAAAEYTVTFVDENSATIKTETVIHGHAATAPTAPLRENTIFKEWDTAFDNVRGDLTVTAVYRQKETYTVTFKDYSGLVLGTASVKETGTVQAPVAPTRDGYTFTGWSSSLDNITANKTVTAKYSLVKTDNVFDIAYGVGQGGQVTLTVSIKGNVRFAALQGEIILPTGVTAGTFTAKNGTVVNLVDNTLKFTYVGMGTDVTSDIELFTWTITSSADTIALTPVFQVFADQNKVTVSYTVAGEEIKLK